MNNEKHNLTDCQRKMKELREEIGMNRKEFCEKFDIPYRTVTEWERGNRNAPDYVLRFMEYYISMERVNLYKQKNDMSECLETNRLWIRHFEPEDAKSCHDGWGQDERLGKYILGYPMDKKQMLSFVTSLSRNENAWVFIEKESNCRIGYLIIDIPYVQTGVGELGYVIGEKYQKKGYAYEALNKIMSIYFRDKKLYMLEAKYNEDNVASAQLLQKLGFAKEGRLRKRRIDFLSGERKDMVVCSITEEEYKEKVDYEEQRRFIN